MIERVSDPSSHTNFSEALSLLRVKWRGALTAFVLAGAAGYGAAWLMPPTYTSRTVFVPPQASGGGISAALGSLSALASLTGAGPVASRTAADTMLSLLGTRAILDPIIEKHQLVSVYRVPLVTDARKKLIVNTNAVLGKRDGLIYIDVEDGDPKRAALIANEYVDRLRQVTSQLALSEAQQRRVFFAGHLKTAQENLARAQAALQSAGISSDVLKAEPRAAADGIARIQAEIMAAEVTLEALRTRLQANSPEVRAANSRLSALRAQVARMENSTGSVRPDQSNYITLYREFKYQETLFELFARQYETARIDESRDGGLIQVVDTAIPAERRTRPVRTLIALAAAVSTSILYLMIVCLSRPAQMSRRESDELP